MPAIVGVLKSLLLKLLGGLKGPAGWLVGLIIDKAIAKLTDAFKAWQAKREQDKKDKASEEKYDEVINKPEATHEEIKKAGDDFLNRRDS